MQVEIKGIRGGGSGEEVDIKTTRGGSLHGAQGLPPYAVQTALGTRWSAMTTADVAALVIRPSATSLMTLHNGEAGSGKCYVIDRIFAMQEVSTNVEGRFGLWACVHPVGIEVPTDESITTFNSSRGIGGYAGSAVVDVDESVADNGWFPWGNSVSMETDSTLGGAQVDAVVAGRIILPPKASLSLHVVASLIGEQFTVGASWYEVYLDLA